MDEIKSMLNALLEGQQALNARMTAIEERMERMEGRLSELREEQEGIEKRIHARFSVMQKQHLEYEAWAKDLTRHIESFRDDIRLIVQRLGEHEHEIRKLKTR